MIPPLFESERIIWAQKKTKKPHLTPHDSFCYNFPLWLMLLKLQVCLGSVGVSVSWNCSAPFPQISTLRLWFRMLLPAQDGRRGVAVIFIFTFVPGRFV